MRKQLQQPDRQNAPRLVPLPETPLRILVRDSQAPPGPYKVLFKGLANDAKKRDLEEEEISILAELLIDAFLAWKEQ